MEATSDLQPHKIKTGNVGLVYVPFDWRNSKTYISVPTRWVLDSRISHAVLFWQDGDTLKVVEALPFVGVIETPFSEWIKQFPRGINLLPWECPAGNFTGEIGKRYDMAAALWSHTCYRFTKTWNGRTGVNADRKRFCFELVLKAHGKDKYWMAHPKFLV